MIPMSYYLFLSSILFAQEQYTLSGFIRALDSSEELIGANIVCEALSIGAITNAYGFHSISLPAGTQELRFSFIGYNDQTIEGFCIIVTIFLSICANDNEMIF